MSKQAEIILNLKAMPENRQLDGDEQEETQDSTFGEKRESDDASEDLDSSFEDDSQEEEDEAPEDEAPEDKVKRLEDKIARIEKGVKKLATDRGREQKEKPTEEKVEKTESNVNPVLKSLYFKANPEAQDIWDEVEKDAKELGKDPFVLYEGSAYYKGEAKTRAEAKAKEEESRKKVNKPSSDSDFSKNIAEIKPEDVEKLTPEQKIKWIKAQAEKERNSTD